MIKTHHIQSVCSTIEDVSMAGLEKQSCPENYSCRGNMKGYEEKL